MSIQDLPKPGSGFRATIGPGRQADGKPADPPQGGHGELRHLANPTMPLADAVKGLLADTGSADAVLLNTKPVKTRLPPARKLPAICEPLLLRTATLL